MSTQNATLISKDFPCTDIGVVKLRPSKKYTFKAGQAAVLYLPKDPHGNSPKEPRYYSIASAPEDKEIELHIRRAGATSTYLLDTLKVGDEIELASMPSGAAIYKKVCKKPMLCIAGGTGLSQIKSITCAALTNRHEAEIHLCHAVSDPTHGYMNDFFGPLQAKHPQLKYQMITDISGGSGKLIGTIEAAHSTLKNWRAYISGPPPMIEAVIPILLAKGIDEKRIHADNWSLNKN